ncbi:sperm microtubule inner protein 11 [Pholidichthys leucotaenia]
MAFFGLTHLGYQNPIGDKMILNPREASHKDDTNINARAGVAPSLQEQQGPLTQQSRPHSKDMHHGSHERYKQMVKKVKTPSSPDKLYVTPLTDNQQYGWRISDSREPWMRVKLFPRKNSEITKFVQEMSLRDREFSLF